MPIPMKPGKPEKYDYEYVRNGTADIFVAVEFKAGKRVTQVTKRRTMKDFALFVKMLVDEYPDVEVIQLVTDNLNAAEIEINVMDIECTGRRIADKETLVREVAAWTKRRNAQRKKINWKFTRDTADKKLSKYYVP